MPGMGPPPKSTNARQRRNATFSMTQLPAEGRGPKRAPNWPLAPDVVMTVRRDLAAKKVERLTLDREELQAEGKSITAVERRLDAALEQMYILEAQLKAQRRLETELWRDLWRLPQAVQWYRLKWTRDVAQYVRHKVLAELGDMDAAKEARQWSDRLGLTPLAMLRLRWVVAVDELAEKRNERNERAQSAPEPVGQSGGEDPLAALRAL
ncbi:MAG: hypothetical protein JWO67_2566 [Streptosporangiaceae bacterium]|nr:hypothetical protein [Streptosporangiaceae bacterium]